MRDIDRLLKNVRVEIEENDYEIVEEINVTEGGTYIKVKSKTRGHRMLRIEHMETSKYKIFAVTVPMLAYDPQESMAMFLGTVNTEIRFRKTTKRNVYYSVIITDMKIPEKMVLIP